MNKNIKQSYKEYSDLYQQILSEEHSLEGELAHQFRKGKPISDSDIDRLANFWGGNKGMLSRIQELELYSQCLERISAKENAEMKAHAESQSRRGDRLAESLRECLKCHSENAPIHATITKALAQWEQQ